MIKIAMVGTGIIAHEHLMAIEKTDKAELVAVADINESAAMKVGMKFSVPYYTDYKEMTEKESFDAVILNLPHFLHCEVTVYFLEKGIHVLCEKPMANTLEECDKMIEASEKYGAKLAIAHVTRHNAINKCIKKFIKEKTLGELCMHTEIRTTSYFSDSRPKWFTDKKLSGGGLLMNYGAHSIETLMYVTDGKISDINADIGNLLDKDGVDAHSQIKLKINGTIPCSLTFCGYPSLTYSEKIYYFTNGTIKDNSTNKLYICDMPNGEFKPYEVENANMFETQLDEFIKYINGEDCDVSDGADGRRVIEAITEIYSQQAQNNM